MIDRHHSNASISPTLLCLAWNIFLFAIIVYLPFRLLKIFLIDVLFFDVIVVSRLIENHLELWCIPDPELLNEFFTALKNSEVVKRNGITNCFETFEFSQVNFFGHDQFFDLTTNGLFVIKRKQSHKFVLALD